MIKFFNKDSIISAKESFQKAPSGFRYGFIPNLFKEEVYEKLTDTFPDVRTFKLLEKMRGGSRKRFYHGPVYDTDRWGGCVCHLESLPVIWKDVLEEAHSPELISLLRESTGIDFNSLSHFGYTFGDEGCMQEPHIDGAVRENPDSIKSPIACLMYLNKSPEGSSGTCIYDVDAKTILFKVSDLRNSMLFFEQHVDAWHGFPTVLPGEERRLVSVAYNKEKKPIKIQDSLVHKIFCVSGLKYRIRQRLGRSSPGRV